MDAIAAEELFSLLLNSVSYRSYDRTQWASLPISCIPNNMLEARGKFSRADFQQLLLSCAGAAREQSGTDEALVLLLAAHAVLPLIPQSLCDLAILLFPVLLPETDSYSLPLPASPRWRSFTMPPAGEWVDVPVRLLLWDGRRASTPERGERFASDTSVSPDLLYQAWQNLRNWYTWAEEQMKIGGETAPEARRICALIRLAALSSPSSEMVPHWATKAFRGRTDDSQFESDLPTL